MIIRTKAYPRAGLVGNPSDGFFGRTISFTFSNFQVDVVLYESPDLEIIPHERDHSRFSSLADLAQDVNTYGYYGGIRLIKATLKRFHDYAKGEGIPLHERNFSIRYHSTIPVGVGLAGSSAIITATLRALMGFYQVEIPRPVQANLVLSVETTELKIPAGLQDRVAQVYEGLIYMDFDRLLMQRQGYGFYEPIDPTLLPNLYIAYREDLAEGTEVFHNDLRERFNSGEQAVIEAVAFWADLAKKVRQLLLDGKGSEIAPLLDANFDRRRQVCKLRGGNCEMVMAARSAGASAKFTGSGGAIVGTYENEAMFKKLVKTLAALGVRVLRPDIVVSEGSLA